MNTFNIGLATVFLLFSGSTLQVPPAPQQPRGFSIPIVDVSTETGRQTVVDRESGQYLAHPTTVQLEDGRTILAVYPKGHGRGVQG